MPPSADWKSDYASGFDHIDAAHKAILLQCGVLVVAAQEEAAAFQHALETLFSLVLDHFHDEERLLGHLVGDIHARQHQEDHKIITRFLADAEAYEASRCATAESRLRFARMIEAWILREIASTDSLALDAARRSAL
jgi:hemerythrin-like metal-binding protein